MAIVSDWTFRWRNIPVTWSSEEERLNMRGKDWMKEAVIEYDMYRSNFDAVFPPAKNTDFRNCDYFVYKGVCYGIGTEVKLKDCPFYARHRDKNRRYRAGKFGRDFDFSKIELRAQFTDARMNGLMLFRYVRKAMPEYGVTRDEYGEYEASAFIPEDYIEEITKPVIVRRSIGQPNVLGNLKNLNPADKAKLSAQLWPQLFFAGLLLLLCVFTNAHEFWPVLICCIIYFAVWISFRANHW